MFDLIEEERELDNQIDSLLQYGTVGCALPDAGRVAAIGLALMVLAMALGLWLINRMRPW